MVTMQNWMFLSSFEDMRKNLIANRTISVFNQIGYNSFPEINSKIAQACAFSIFSNKVIGFSGRYIDLNSCPQSADKNQVFKSRTSSIIHDLNQDKFEKIPGRPIAYWVSQESMRAFSNGVAIGKIAETRKGMGIGDNARFVRYWYEVSSERTMFSCVSRDEAKNSKRRWFPYNDGGPFRKWYGNNDSVVNWEDDGLEAKENAIIKNNGSHWSRYLVSLDYFFIPGITWTAISSAKFSARLFGNGFLFSSAGMCLFSSKEEQLFHLGFLNSIVSSHLLKFLSPTLNPPASE